MKNLPPEFPARFQARIQELWEAFSKESIRVMIIIMAAEIDRLLLESIKAFIKPERKKNDDEKLFGGFGPLNSFSTRIEMAYRLGLISTEDADGLDQLRKLRNHCAHTIKEFSLDAEPFKSLFRHFMDCTINRDDLGLCLSGVICPKTDEELTFFACVSYVVKQELTLTTIGKTENHFFQRKLSSDDRKGT